MLEDGALASGMTSVTTAHLSNAIDDRISEIERWHGEEGARLAVESHGAAIDRIEAIANELDVDCDFRPARRLFVPAPRATTRTFSTGSWPPPTAPVCWMRRSCRRARWNIDTGPAIRFPNQARFHPLKYLAAIAQAIKAKAARSTPTATPTTSKAATRPGSKSASHKVTADAIVVATNTPINDLVAIHTKQAPYMTYVIGARVPQGSVESDALYWDTLKAYHYVRLQEVDGR